ncbi:MliC family protein [Vibrio zhugei]|uniref:MliC family protein n=1 Tax=Vibrio zhugei TaxID=2479546 RepID=A0ABV7CC98_9VIBR|nr:MliC family protein [Vibrio zhugei]
MIWKKSSLVTGLALGSLGLTGCVDVDSQSAPLDSDELIPHAVTYRCGSLQDIYVQYTDSDVITLSTQHETSILKGAESASGARYVGEHVEFWTKGETALLTMDGTLYHCVAPR